MDTCKTSGGTLYQILASGSAAAGQLTLNVQEPLKCYCPNVTKITPGSHALHHLVNHNFQHTKTHTLGPLASIGGIPVLRGGSPLGTTTSVATYTSHLLSTTTGTFQTMKAKVFSS